MATWPRRAADLSEIPELYRPELEPWLQRRAAARLLFFPLFDKRTGNRPEYAAAWDKNTLLLLVRRPEGTLIRTEIQQQARPSGAVFPLDPGLQRHGRLPRRRCRKKRGLSFQLLH